MGEGHYFIKLFGGGQGEANEVFFFIWVISVTPGYLKLTAPSFGWIVEESFWDRSGIKNDLYYEGGKWGNFTVMVKEESHITLGMPVFTLDKEIGSLLMISV